MVLLWLSEIRAKSALCDLISFLAWEPYAFGFWDAIGCGSRFRVSRRCLPIGLIEAHACVEIVSVFDAA